MHQGIYVILIWLNEEKTIDPHSKYCPGPAIRDVLEKEENKKNDSRTHSYYG
jgi:hypothetical protein